MNFGRGCNADTYLADPSGKIALIERGTCRFVEKVSKAKAAGATAAIIYNSTGNFLTRGEDVFEMGGGSQLSWLHIPAAATAIPAVFVQRSTGLALINNSGGGTTPVTVFVKE